MEIHEGVSLLECVVRRFQMADRVDEVVVATTVEAGDDPIADWCAANRVSVFRGSEDNVLQRVADAALQYRADAVVQMGADSAYLDYQLIDQLVKHYASGSFDYVCNDLRLTYPLGIYGHVVRADVLIELSQHKDLSDEDRCDVVRYIWENPQAYAISSVEAPKELLYPELRLTIDYPEDLQQVRDVYRHFGHDRFTTVEVIELCRQKPAIFEKTRKLVQHSAPFLKAE